MCLCKVLSSLKLNEQKNDNFLPKESHLVRVQGTFPIKSKAMIVQQVFLKCLCCKNIS